MSSFEVKEFTLDGINGVVGKHLAVTYKESCRPSDLVRDEYKVFTYTVHPVVYLYGHRYIAHVINIGQGDNRGLLETKEYSKRIVRENDAYNIYNTWYWHYGNNESVWVGQIVSQDCNAIYISTCNLSQYMGVISQTYTTMLTYNIDPKDFDTNDSSKIDYVQATILSSPEVKYSSCTKEGTDLYGFIHIHD